MGSHPFSLREEMRVTGGAEPAQRFEALGAVALSLREVSGGGGGRDVEVVFSQAGTVPVGENFDCGLTMAL